jgi:hypothetical protein
MGCWLWLSYRFEEGSFPGRERVQALTRTLCHWLNLGLASIQVNAAQAAADAAEGASSLQAAADADAEEDAVISSSDADEINEACFTTLVAEAPPAAADAAGYDGEEQQPAGQDAASSGPGGVTPSSEQLDELLRRMEQEERRRQHDPYVRWTGAVASGVAAASSSSSIAASSSALGLHQQVAPEAAGLADGLDGSLSGEALQQLLMPEFEASMAPYVRWVSRPRFRPPPAPLQAGVGVAGGCRREA